MCKYFKKETVSSIDREHFLGQFWHLNRVSELSLPCTVRKFKGYYILNTNPIQRKNPDLAYLADSIFNFEYDHTFVITISRNFNFDFRVTLILCNFNFI